MEKIKIMTFNTENCNSFIEQKIDFDVMAKAIKDCGADIVGLNEMRNKGSFEGYDNQTEILSKLTGIENYYFAQAVDLGENLPFGNGLLSKYQIKSVENISIPDPNPKMYDGYYQTRCILKAKLENGLTVMVTHFGLNPDEQQNAVDTIMANLEDEKCILVGDFNVLPDNEVLKPIKEKMVDTAVYFKEPLLSWPSDNPERKIDYVFVTQDIEIIDADIPAIVASDHRPHTVTISF